MSDEAARGLYEESPELMEQHVHDGGTRFMPPQKEGYGVEHIDASAERQRLTDEDVRKVVAKFPNLIEIDLAGCEKLTDAAIVEIARHCPQLQSLDVT